METNFNPTNNNYNSNNNQSMSINDSRNQFMNTSMNLNDSNVHNNSNNIGYRYNSNMNNSQNNNQRLEEMFKLYQIMKQNPMIMGMFNMSNMSNMDNMGNMGNMGNKMGNMNPSNMNNAQYSNNNPDQQQFPSLNKPYNRQMSSPTSNNNQRNQINNRIQNKKQENYQFDSKYFPSQNYQQIPRKHQRGKDVLKAYTNTVGESIKNASTNINRNPKQQLTIKNNVLNDIGDSFVSNYQEQAPQMVANTAIVKNSNLIGQQEKQKPSLNKAPINFDDMPIKPMKGNAFDQMPINANTNPNININMKKPINTAKNNPQLKIDSLQQKPIKSKYTDQISTSREYQKNQSYMNQKKQLLNSPRKEQLYNQMEQRPISGCANKNFDQMLSQQLSRQGMSTEAFSQTYSNSHKEEQYQNRPKPTKTFLRKGTRQHLSSGLDRKAINPTNKKKNQKQKDSNNNQFYNEENSETMMNMDRDITPKNNRSTSQNRVLNNKKREDLSVSKNNGNAPKIDTRQKKQFINNYVQEDSQNNRSFTGNSNLQPKNNRKTTPIKNSITNNSPNVSRNHNNNNINRGNASPRYNINKKSQKVPTKQKINVFEDSDSQQNEGSAQFPNTNKSYQSKKIQAIPGIYLTQQQIQQIVRKNSRTLKQQQQKLQKLRSKYNDLCQIIQQQRTQLKQQLQQQKQQFQNYKVSQMNKIKNQRRVMQRQVKNSHAKDFNANKQELQNLTKQLQKQRQENKKKDKNNRILIEKYKKEVQQLKYKLSSQVENQSQSIHQSRSHNYQVSDHSDHSTNKEKSNQVKNKNTNKQEIKKKKNMDDQDFNHRNTIQKNDEYSESSGYGKQTVKQRSNISNLPEYNSLKNNNGASSLNNSKKQPKFNYVDQDSKYKKTQSKDKDKDKNKNKNKFYQQYSDDDKNSDQDDYQSDHSFGKSKNQEQNSEYYPITMDLSSLAQQQLSIKKITPGLIEKLFRYDKHPQYISYLNKKLSPGRRITHTSENTVDGRTTHMYNDDGKQIIFNTGVKKQYFPNGYMIIHFKNGDIKQKLSDGTILYYFHQKQVDQITFLNQINIYRFDNNQLEFHFPDNRIQIRHPDGTIKVMSH